VPCTKETTDNIGLLFDNEIDALLNKALDIRSREGRVKYIRRQPIEESLKRQIIGMLSYVDNDDDDISLALISESEGITGKHLIGRLAGKLLNDEFILKDIISLTGNSAVYIASRISKDNDGFRQKVAIKVILPILEKIMGQSAVAHEAQIISQCKHHNIVKVLSSGRIEADGIKFPCLVMEYISGVNLLTHMNAERLDTVDRLKLFFDVCAAVKYLHSRPIIHGDLKPENIIVDETGCVKIVDFTLGVSEQTKLSDYRGMSTEYASQEHLSGFAPTVACDVFSLGIILEHIIHGRTEGGSHIANNGKSLPIISLTGTNAIINRAKNIKPEKRYNTVEALGYDVRQVLKKFPIIERQKLPLDIVSNLFFRRPIWMALFCGAIGLLAFAFIQQSLTKRELEITVDRLQLEKKATSYVTDRLTSLLNYTDVRHLKGEKINTEDLLNKTESITRDSRLPVDFRFSLAMKYGAMRLGTGNIEEAINNFKSAYNIAKQWSGTNQGLPKNSLYDAATKLSEAHFANDNYIKVIEIGEEHIPDILTMKEPRKELVPILKFYFKARSKNTSEPTPLLNALISNMRLYFDRNISDATPEEIIEFNYDLANMLYYQFSGDEFSITSGKTDDEIVDVRKVMLIAKKALSDSIAVAEKIQHFQLSAHYALAAKVDFELGGVHYLKYGKRAVDLAIKTYQTKYHISVMKTYLKYFSVAAPFDHQLSYELLNEAKEIQDTLNEKGTSLTHIIDVFYGTRTFYMGSIKEVQERADKFNGQYSALDDYYMKLSLGHTFWNMHNIYGFPTLSQKSFDYLKEYKSEFVFDGEQTVESLYYKFVDAYLQGIDYEVFTGVGHVEVLKITQDDFFSGTRLLDFARMYALAGKTDVALNFINSSEDRTHFNPREIGTTFEYADFYAAKAQVYAILKDWEGMKTSNEKALLVINSSNTEGPKEYLSILTHYHKSLYSIYGKNPDYNIAKDNLDKLYEIFNASGLDSTHPLKDELSKLYIYVFSKM
tara:strand:- start:600 stop:3605 length:3006 start_codon:yes stop_codon:yes gene_type:complete